MDADKENVRAGFSINCIVFYLISVAKLYIWLEGMQALKRLGGMDVIRFLLILDIMFPCTNRAREGCS